MASLSNSAALGASNTHKIIGLSGQRREWARAWAALDVPVLAQSVEDEALLPVLVQLGVSGFQGYAAGAPEPLAG